jgi:hypothetical protein
MRASRKQAKEEAMDPSVPEDYSDAVLKAIQLYKGYGEGHPDGWLLEDCYLNMGIKKTSFFKFLKLHNEDMLEKESINSASGRSRLLSEEAKQELYDEVERLSLDLRSVKSGPPFLKMVVEKIRSEATNRLVEFTPSSSYMRKLTKLFLVVDKACVKNKARLKAYENIRNALGIAAAVHAYQHMGLSPHMWTSFDDVSVYLNNNEKPRVITTKRAQEFLATQKLSVSTDDENVQKRMITFNCLIACDGSLLSKVAKISDRLFVDYKLRPGMFSFGEGERKMYVVLAHPDLPDGDLYRGILKSIILPAAVKYRERIIKQQSADVNEVQSSQGSSASGAAVRVGSQQSVASVREAEENRAIPPLDQLAPVFERVEGDEVDKGGAMEVVDEVEDEEDEEDEGGGYPGGGGASSMGGAETVQPRAEQYKTIFHPSYYLLKNPVTPELAHAAEYYARVIIASDGAAGQIEAMLEELTNRIQKGDLPVDLIKYAGGCSMTQSANDIGAMHRILHALFKSLSYRYEDVDDLPGGDVKGLKRKLKKAGLAGQHFQTYWKCLMHAPDFLARAFQPTHIKSAFKSAGICPPNIKKILSVNPFFRHMCTADAQFVVDTVPELAAVFTEKNQIEELDYDNIMYREGTGRMDNVPTKTTGKPLNDCVANRQRVAKVNGPTFHAKYAPMAADNKAGRVSKKKTKAAAVAATAASLTSAGTTGSSSSSSSSAAAGLSATSTTAAPSATAASTTASATTSTTAASGMKRKRVSISEPPVAIATTTTTTTTTTDTTTGITDTTAADTTAAAGQPAKKKRKPAQKKCVSPGCTIKLDTTKLTSQWLLCGINKMCKMYFCGGTADCVKNLQQHRAVCGT